MGAGGGKQRLGELPAKSELKRAGRAFVCPKSTSPGQLTLSPSPLHHPRPQSCPTIMDITDFIFSQREDVLLVGDYNAYRAHASRKLHKLRKKLGQTTPKGRKYTPKSPVSAEDVGNNVAYVLRLCFCSIRLMLMLTVDSKICVPLAPQRGTGLGSSNAHEVYPLG